MEIRAYQKGDEHKILELFQLAFGKNLSNDYWQWRFMNNPFCPQPYIDLMWDNEKLVGHYAVSPTDMIAGKTLLKTALSMTTMTHPEYGGKGIFSKLATSLYNRLESDGFSMVWGFPNNNSHYGFNKNLGWQDIAVQGMMSLSADLLSQKIKDLSPIGKVLLSNDSTLANVSDKLNTSNKYLRIDKTPAYLQWRYANNPTADYKITSTDDGKGILIYKVISSFSQNGMSEIDIMDWAFDNDTTIALTLLALVMSNEKNIVKFNLWDSLFSHNQINLEKIGFRLQAPLTYLGYKPLLNNNSKLGEYANWDISFCYSDVF